VPGVFRGERAIGEKTGSLTPIDNHYAIPTGAEPPKRAAPDRQGIGVRRARRENGVLAEASRIAEPASDAIGFRRPRKDVADVAKFVVSEDRVGPFDVEVAIFEVADELEGAAMIEAHPIPPKRDRIADGFIAHTEIKQRLNLGQCHQLAKPVLGNDFGRGEGELHCRVSPATQQCSRTTETGIKSRPDSKAAIQLNC
jgi:hypothetical protein